MVQNNNIFLFLSTIKLLIILAGILAINSCECPPLADTEKKISPINYAWGSVIHSLPANSSYTLKMNKIQIFDNIEYNSFTDYAKIPSGLNFFTLIDNNTKQVVLNSPVEATQYANYTFLIYPKGNLFGLITLEDTKVLPQSSSLIRLINIANNSPTIIYQIIQSNDGEILLSDELRFKEYTDLTEFPAKICDIKLIEKSTNRIVGLLKDVQFQGDKLYNIVLNGEFGIISDDDKVNLNLHSPQFP